MMKMLINEMCLQRQLSEARLELDRHRDQSLRLAEQLKTANEHLEFLKTEVSYFYSSQLSVYFSSLIYLIYILFLIHFILS